MTVPTNKYIIERIKTILIFEASKNSGLAANELGEYMALRKEGSMLKQWRAWSLSLVASNLNILAFRIVNNYN